MSSSHSPISPKTAPGCLHTCKARGQLSRHTPKTSMNEDRRKTRRLGVQRLNNSNTQHIHLFGTYCIPGPARSAFLFCLV